MTGLGLLPRGSWMVVALLLFVAVSSWSEGWKQVYASGETPEKAADASTSSRRADFGHAGEGTRSSLSTKVEPSASPNTDGQSHRRVDPRPNSPVAVEHVLRVHCNSGGFGNRIGWWLTAAAIGEALGMPVLSMLQ